MNSKLSVALLPLEPMPKFNYVALDARGQESVG